MVRWFAVVAIASLLALTGCSPEDSDLPPVSSTPATSSSLPSSSSSSPTVTVDVADVAVVSTAQAGVVFDISVLPVEAVELPSESLAPSDGVFVEVRGTLTMPVEMRLALADPPSRDAVPMAWHIDDDGVARMVPGVWDQDTNELVVMTTEFSGWIPDWLNPVSWVAGIVDLVADSVTGRTDPPGCGEPAPEWASFVPPTGTGTVHSCFQSNIDEGTGGVRAEVLFKSNRRGFQAVTVPAGASYTWVEGQPDWIRPSLAWLTGAGTTTSILLPGGMSTSFGFDQPEISTDVGIAVYTTPGTILMDGGLAMLGVMIGASSADIVSLAVAINSCALSMYEVDVFQGDFTVEADTDSFLTSLLTCSLEVLPGLADPDIASAAIVSLDNANLLGAASAGGHGEQVRRLIDSANRLGSIAKRAANAVAIASASVDLWDKVLDNGISRQAAQLSMTGYGSTNIGSKTNEAVMAAAWIDPDNVLHALVGEAELSLNTFGGAEVVGPEVLGGRDFDGDGIEEIMVSYAEGNELYMQIVSVVDSKLTVVFDQPSAGSALWDEGVECTDSPIGTLLRAWAVFPGGDNAEWIFADATYRIDGSNLISVSRSERTVAFDGDPYDDSETPEHEAFRRNDCAPASRLDGRPEPVGFPVWRIPSHGETSAVVYITVASFDAPDWEVQIENGHARLAEIGLDLWQGWGSASCDLDANDEQAYSGPDGATLGVYFDTADEARRFAAEWERYFGEPPVAVIDEVRTFCLD